MKRFALLVILVILTSGCVVKDRELELPLADVEPVSPSCEIKCLHDSDCDDGSSASIDKCMQPGTCDSWCSHGVPKVEGRLYKVGEPLWFSTIEMTVLSAEKTWAYQSPLKGVTEAEPGEYFLLVDVQIRNHGEKSVYVPATVFELTSKDGFWSLRHGTAPKDYFGKETPSWKSQLPGNETFEGILVIDFPADAKDLVVSYDFSSIMGRPAYGGWELGRID